MSDQQLVFLAHDPGSCDALYPVYKAWQEPARFVALGPSATRLPAYAVTWSETEPILLQLAAANKLLGVVIGRDWGTDLDVQVLHWTQAHAIKSVVLLDYWSNYASSFRDTSGKQYWPDAYFVMDELAKREALADGVPENILHIVGQPALDQYAVQQRTPTRDILFLSQPLSALYDNQLGYTEWSALADVLSVAQKCERQVDVKFHPKDVPGFRNQYQSLAVDGDVDVLMLQYRLVIGMSTMALLHAALMGIPVVSYQPGLRGNDGCITNKLGLSRGLTDTDALQAVLSGDEDWRPPARSPGQSLVWQDGKSVERTVQALQNVFTLS